MSRLIFLVVIAFTLATLPAFAQNKIRVRGTIERVEGPILVVKARDGSEVRIKPTDNAKIVGVAKISLSDIKPGSFVGAAAVPAAGDMLKALEVHVFPEDMRGTGEGHQPYDLQPNSTMTNATVVDVVMGKDGQTLLLKYKDGEKKITVTRDTPVVTYVPADRGELKPGAKIVVFNATRADDGTIEAARFNVGKDGLTPPM